MNEEIALFVMITLAVGIVALALPLAIALERRLLVDCDGCHVDRPRLNAKMRD